MNDTLELIRKLSKESDVGILFCYKALKKFDYDYQKALGYLASDTFKNSVNVLRRVCNPSVYEEIDEMKGNIADMENELLNHLDKLHTTELGAARIKRNLSLDTDDVVSWCREKIENDTAVITREGKNWYIDAEACRITVNAYSYTIITAHRRR